MDEWTVDYSIESWGIRSASKGLILALLWSGGAGVLSGTYTESLEKMGAAEARAGFRYKNAGSEGDTLGHYLLLQHFGWHATSTQAHASSGSPLVGSPHCLVLCVATYGHCLDWCQLFPALGHPASRARGG